MCRKGEITVFLAMILFSVCALLCVIVESARTAGARCYLRMAVDSSADSLMAQYHRELWNKYRILGLEYDKTETLEKEFREFMRPYMEAGNWYPMKADQIRITDMTGLTQGDGRYFEQEILDYMKYGLLDMDWDELDEAGAGELLVAWKEGNSVNRVSELYSAHSREAVRVEKALEIINSTLLAQRERWEQGKDCLEQPDGGRFISQANKMIRELERIPGQVKSYEKRADELYVKLANSRERFLEETSDLSGDVRAALEEEISQYESYAAQDGQRRREVEALTNLSRDRIQWIGDVINMAEEVMEYISNWEPEDEDDELDEAALWQPVRARWSQYGMLLLGVEFGVRDKEKEGFLEQVGNMAGKGMLELVLPEGTVVSGTDLRLSGTPSVQRKTDGGGLKEKDRDGDSQSTGFLTGARTLIQRLIIGEYDIRFFKGFKKEMQKGEFYELEYIIHGKKKDKDNLSGVAARLVAFREGLNLIHILSDSGKRQEARSLALTIVGGTGILPLVSVVAFFIMAVWALGEALLDVRCLLEGKKVPVFKTVSDWKLDLAGLLEMGRSGSLIDGEGGGDGSGIDYEGYLRILIFGGYDTDLVYRMMDVMQIVTARKQPGFSLENCVCTVNAEALVSGKHVFFSNGVWKSRGPEDGYAYDTRMAVAGSYLEDYKSP
ncbi:DUF5702 domain-containing protein [Enterocloster clostridioformis]|uniref:DUF5702 domain-containing protein n=1 Tax=Enterocloster clostridioformis TaxID=1531 RepID=UPI000413C236|nr:DUF5702 domain-containing protein [Enterocloster clostridioformis]